MDTFLNHFIGSLIAPSSGAAAIALNTMQTWRPEMMEPVRQALDEISPEKSRMLAKVCENQFQTAVFFKELKTSNRFRLYEKLYQPTKDKEELRNDLENLIEAQFLHRQQLRQAYMSEAHAEFAGRSGDALHKTELSIPPKLLENGPLMVDFLLDYMRAPDKEDQHASIALSFLMGMAQLSPYVFYRIANAWVSFKERTPEDAVFLWRLNLILGSFLRNSYFEVQSVLDRMAEEHPVDGPFFENCRKSGVAWNTLTPVLGLKEDDTEIRLAIISDIHYSEVNADFAEDVAVRVRKANPHILLMAGDIANDLEHFEKALKLFQGDWKLLVLPGNHDLWSTWKNEKETPNWEAPTTDELWNHVLPQIVKSAGAIWLEEKSVVIPGAHLAIAGTIGWYDYSGERRGRSETEIVAGRENTNASRIDWENNDPTFATARRLWLEAKLSHLSNLPYVDRILVTTHMVPFSATARKAEESLDSQDWFQRRAPFYVTPTLGETIRPFAKVTDVVSGHHHFGAEVMIEREGMPPIRTRILAEEDKSTPHRTNEIALFHFPWRKDWTED